MQLQAVGDKIHVRIDKSKQLRKKELNHGLIVPPAFEYMIYNLQYGQITSVGDGVKDPDVRVGRTAILHHTVEDRDQNLFHIEADRNELRIVRVTKDKQSFQLFGVLDEEGNIIPYDDFIFVHPEDKQDDNLVNEEVQTEQYGRVNITGRQVGSLIIPKVPGAHEEEDLHIVTEVIAVGKSEEVIKPGDRLLSDAFSKYPIELMGRTYWILQREYVLSIVP
jgi:co-chaperonin GroES (HSP10)